MSSFLQWGAEITREVQLLGPGFLLPARGITFLGSEDFFLLLVTLIYWCLDCSLGIRLAFLLISADGLTGLFKLGFHMPRPYWVDPGVRALAAETSYGLPSGHASASSSVALLFAQRIRRWWFWVLAGVLVVAIAWSRVYLGVHFPTDVVAGWMVGGLVWVLFSSFAPRVGAWISRASLALQLALVVAASLLVLVLTGGVLAAVASQADPPQWAVLAARATGGMFANPRSPSDLVAEAGLLLGLGTGAVLSRRWARYDPAGRVSQRALRYLVGACGILLWEGGLPRLLAGVPAWNTLTLLYLRSAITGFWAVFLAPLVFLSLGLARETT